MSDEMKGEVPFSNADILKRAAESRKSFYETLERVMSRITPEDVRGMTPPNHPRAKYGGLFGGTNKIGEN